jgi:hypothetical protein
MPDLRIAIFELKNKTFGMLGGVRCSARHAPSMSESPDGRRARVS